jgi:hypothetical protein
MVFLGWNNCNQVHRWVATVRAALHNTILGLVSAMNFCVMYGMRSRCHT